MSFRRLRGSAPRTKTSSLAFIEGQNNLHRCLLLHPRSWLLRHDWYPLLDLASSTGSLERGRVRIFLNLNEPDWTHSKRWSVLANFDFVWGAWGYGAVCACTCSGSDEGGRVIPGTGKRKPRRLSSNAWSCNCLGGRLPRAQNIARAPSPPIPSRISLSLYIYPLPLLSIQHCSLLCYAPHPRASYARLVYSSPRLVNALLYCQLSDCHLDQTCVPLHTSRTSHVHLPPEYAAITHIH